MSYHSDWFPWSKTRNYQLRIDKSFIQLTRRGTDDASGRRIWYEICSINLKGVKVRIGLDICLATNGIVREGPSERGGGAKVGKIWNILSINHGRRNSVLQLDYLRNNGRLPELSLQRAAKGPESISTSWRE